MEAPLVREYRAPEINRDEIFRYLGQRRPEEQLSSLVEECIKEVDGALSYKVCYAELSIKAEGELLDLGFTKTDSRALERVLSGCDSIVLFAATLGVGADRLIMRYSARNPAKALVLDAIFTERIEALCDTFCLEIKKEMERRGCETQKRFSAGYADFPLEAQRDVFLCLTPEKNIGVHLNSTLLMTPTKSVTAIIGIRKIDEKTAF
ncbi:MAG: Vitamin B12 dependent methionine synthase activation subunit [Clostridia bacterium]|nr:Vitamin B12 dependent methionine synthase activation subunit [Clostridia bacterium]